MGFHSQVMGGVGVPEMYLDSEPTAAAAAAGFDSLDSLGV